MSAPASKGSESSTGLAGISGTHFSIAAWVQAPRDRATDHVLVSRGSSGWGFFRLYIQKRFGFLRFNCVNLGDYGCGVVDDGLWHHVAVSCDGRDMSFFLDGLKLYTFDIPGGPSPSDEPVTIGSMPDGSLPFAGKVEDLRGMDHPLDESQVRQIMREHPHTNPPPGPSRVPPAPLFEDPLFNSAKDGTVVWNRRERNWWFIYMQIRNAFVEPGAAIHHGTTLGAASSNDGGLTWTYRGTLRGLEWEKGLNTFWAPDIVWTGGRYLAVIAYVHGIQPTWQGDRLLLLYTSDDLMHWTPAGRIEGLASARTLDACLYPMPDGMWGMWYKDETRDQTMFAEGDSKFRFREVGPLDPTAPAAEGPDVFHWKGYYWLLADDCTSYNGQRVYRSTDCRNWERRQNILDQSGRRPTDAGPAHHAEVILTGDQATVFYWTTADPWTTAQAGQDSRQICYLQAAKLQIADGELICDRNAQFELRLPDGLS